MITKLNVSEKKKKKISLLTALETKYNTQGDKDETLLNLSKITLKI